MASVKYRTIFEGLEKTLDGAKRKFVKKLLEQDDLPMDEPDGDEGGDHRQLLLAAIAKLLDNDDDDSLKKADQIYKILKPKKETPAEEADDEDDAPADKKDDDSKEEAEDDEEKDDEKDDKKESVQVQLDRLKRKDAVRDLCESEKVTPSKSLLTALCAMESVADRKALLQEFKGVKPSKGRTDVTPSKDGKTTAGVGLTESETEFTDEARAKRAALLRN
jgi:hypothetical protein